ncbi:MAG: hypothetical protein H5T86_06250 [Armatimonadetes bacterium]|nr:hypothetical protein [Armatimonadota bacterium]
MLPRQRIEAAFAGAKPDKVPVFHAGWSSWAASVVLGREAFVGGGIQQWREACALWEGPDAHAEFLERSFRDAVAVSLASGQDMLRVEYWRYALKPTERIDEYTFLYGDPDGRFEVRRFDPQTELYQVVDRSPEPEPTYEELERQVDTMERSLDSYRPGPQTFPEYARAFTVFGVDYAIAGAGVGLGIGQSEVWLRAVAERPDLVGRWLDVQAERACRNASAMRQIGIKFLRGGGDFAGKHGPIYSPKAFRELMVPRLRKTSECCHRLGCFHLFASDGNLWPVADDLFGQSGVDGYYEIDKLAGMDLRLLRARFPELTLIGGIDSRTLHLGTREQVVAETLEALEAAHELGRIIVGVSNYPVPGTPPENIIAMLDTIRENR